MDTMVCSSQDAYLAMEWELIMPRVQAFTPSQLFHPDEGNVSWWAQGKHQFYVCFVRLVTGGFEYYKIPGKGWKIGSRWSFNPTLAEKNDLLTGRWWGVAIPSEGVEGRMEVPGGAETMPFALRAAVCARTGPNTPPLALVLHFQRPSEYGRWFNHNDLHLLRCSSVPPDVNSTLRQRAGLEGPSHARSEGYHNFQAGRTRVGYGRARSQAPPADGRYS